MDAIIQKSIASDSDMQKIRQYTRRELQPEEIYSFNVTLCNNDVDRDFEKFSIPTLNQMAQLFVGKTGIFDHSMSSSDQKARIFDTAVERVAGKKTADGEDYYILKAKAYMLNNADNKSLIDEIDAGIKKEVSVSCSVESAICSICGKDKRKERCEHVAGKSYGTALCFSVLENAVDAYEFSFVAVPAQREAGVTKSFKIREENHMKDVIKNISTCEEDMTITKSQAKEICAYIDDLKQEAELGEAYKKQLSKELVELFKGAFPNVDVGLFASVTSVMTTKELLGIRDGIKNSKPAPKPQLAIAKQTKNDSYSEFRI